MRAEYEPIKNRVMLTLPVGDKSSQMLRGIDAHYSRQERRWWGPANRQFCAKLKESGWECDDTVVKLANSFAETMKKAKAAKEADNLEQPPKRKHDLWKHQVRAYHFAYDQESCMLAMDMGTGKSAVAVALAENWDCKTILVICPKAVLPVWRREFAKHCSSEYLMLVCDHGTVAQKQANAQRFMEEEYDGIKVVVVNYDSAKFTPFSSWSQGISWDLIIADESHRSKHHRSKTSGYMSIMHDCGKRRLALTGTPMPHSPLDLFGQYLFVDKTVFGRDYLVFRTRYADMNTIYPDKVMRYLNQDELKEKFHARSFRCETGEVLDLPEITHSCVPVELCELTRKIYRQMNQTMIVALKTGVITASNAAVKLIRLQQITSGFTVLNDETIRLVGTDKRDVLEELFESIPLDEPIVVFCHFARDLKVVRQLAEETGRKYGEISGLRSDITSEGQMPEEVQVMGVQYQAGGVGVDLTRARYCIMFSQTWNMGVYDQAIARVHRPGQTKKTTIYHLIARGTIDALIMQAINNRRSVVDEVMERIPTLSEYEDDLE